MSARKKLSILFAVLVCLVILIFGYWYWNMQKMIAKFSVPPPPTSVEAQPVKTALWEHTLTAVGTFNATKGLDIHPETSGIVREIHFQSGQMVQQNAPLFTLNDSVEQAQRKQQAAKLRIAQLDYRRKSELGDTHLIPQATIDQAKATLDESEAMLAQIDAMIAQKHIRAPFSGQVGIRQVSIGEYVSPSKALVSLQMQDPIHFDFTIPEQFLSEIKNGQRISAKVEGTNHSYQGTITALNAAVDTDSHTILVQATFENPHHELTPGIFASTTIHTGVNETVLVVPQTAVTYSLYGDSVYTVQSDPKEKHKSIVVRKTVKTGERRGSEVVIVSGLQQGEQVVTAGQLKLQDKAAVSIVHPK